MDNNKYDVDPPEPEAPEDPEYAVCRKCKRKYDGGDMDIKLLDRENLPPDGWCDICQIDGKYARRLTSEDYKDAV